MVELFKGIKVDWLGKRKLFFAISVGLLLIGMVSLIMKGRFNYGLDFKGGTSVRVKFDDVIDIGAIRKLLPEANIQAARDIGTANTGGSEFQIELGKAAEAEDASAGREKVTQALNSAFPGKYKIVSAEGVSPKVTGDLRRQAIMATLYALAGILVYIAFRFEWIYGAAAVFAVFHDTLVTLGLFSLFNYEINLTVIAALLTLVGYSVNDTIVVFDRVRENLKMRRRDDLETVLNDSINQTLSRTILTSGLTFLTVLALFVFGGEIINNFAFAMVIGIIVGTYSSVAVAAPLVLVYTNLRRPKVIANRR
jgi:preprotein translocase subunit SecF